MKKNVILLKGIVFLITFLIATGCNSGKKQNDSTPEATDPAQEATKVDIYLKDSLINGTMHLFMYDSKKLKECGVIDDHLIVVKGGYTVKWKNAQESNIDEIMHIRAVGADTTFFGAVPEIDITEVDTIEAFRKGIYKLVLPDSIPLDTLVKYEIIFTVEEEDTTYIIDPYLKIPPQEDPEE